MARLTALQRLEAEAERLDIRPPTAATLRRYGLTAGDWLALLKAQGWVCPICTRRVVSWNVDHHHLPGWKLLPPELRRRYVRGVLCVRCNYRLVHSTIDAETAQRVADYVRAFEARRDKEKT